MWFAFSDVDIFHNGISRKNCCPGETDGATSKEIDGRNGGGAVNRWKSEKPFPLGELVSGLVEIDIHAVRADIENVGRSGSVNIGEMNILLVKLIRVVKPRRVVHRDLCSKGAVSYIWPITNFAVSHAQQVCQSIATH